MRSRSSIFKTSLFRIYLFLQSFTVFLRAEEDILEEPETTYTGFTRYGAISWLYNQGLANPHSYANISAESGAEFSYDSGWSFGVGAIGGWNIFNASANRSASSYGNLVYSGIGDRGDVAQLFSRFKNSRLDFRAGRFNSSYLNFDYLNSYVQGASANLKIENVQYFAAFIDSMLLQNNFKNTLPSLYSGNVIGGYYPYVKKSVFGSLGEVFLAGVSGEFESVKLSSFGLLNTHLRDSKKPLFQIGGDVIIKSQGESSSQTLSLRGIMQYGDSGGDTKRNESLLTGLLWTEYGYSFRIFDLGFGVYGVLGRDNGVYTLDDPSRFYGKVVNSPLSTPSPYFTAQSVGAYTFAGIDLSADKNLPMRVRSTFGGGKYNEASVMLDYQLWRDRDIVINSGMGYVYSHILNEKHYSSLVLFSRLSY